MGYVDGFARDWSYSSVLEMELPQSHAKPFICVLADWLIGFNSLAPGRF